MKKWVVDPVGVISFCIVVLASDSSVRLIIICAIKFANEIT